MTTRTIVTSHPDVACDVCERRLLRGEQHDVFLAAGRRRLVCELCAPRAVHEGWMRESENQPLGLPPTRPRRGRSLFERLRQARFAGAAGAGDPEIAHEDQQHGEPTPYDFLDSSSAPASGSRAARAATPSAGEGETADGEPDQSAEGALLGAEASEPASEREIAVALFNASEHPRRVAGVARSLGAPTVSVRCAEHAASVVRIVVAWELCWYRYEADLDELDAAIRVSGQGTELEELTREERLSNAAAGDSGTLSLSG
jgi:hypothetical protein